MTPPPAATITSAQVPRTSAKKMRRMSLLGGPWDASFGRAPLPLVVFVWGWVSVVMRVSFSYLWQVAGGMAGTTPELWCRNLPLSDPVDAARQSLSAVE